MDPSFNELVERAKWLANEKPIEGKNEVQVELTLPEVLRETEKLHTRLTSQMIDSERAMQLFSSKGIDLQQLSEKVEKLDAQRMFKPDELPDTDVAGFLKQHQQDHIFEMIEECQANVFNTIEKRRQQWKLQEWGQEKQRLLQMFNQADEQQAAPTMTAGGGKAVVPDAATLTAIRRLYAKELANYNKCQQQRVNLLVTFGQLVQQQLHDETTYKMWQVLEHMAKQSPLSLHHDAVQARKQSPQFVQHALLYLELTYREHVDSIIKRTRTAFNCGGIPSVYHKVTILVRLKVQEWQSLHGLVDVVRRRPLWPHVYYALRCGHLPSAMQFLKDWRDPQPELRELLELLQQFKTNPKQSQQNLHYERLKLRVCNEYSERLRFTSDRYMKAVFALVLGCDPGNPHHSVLHGMDDFLWSQLMTRREMQPPLSISDAEGMMQFMYGLDYLNSVETIPVFFQLLVLSGHFEAAIEYLSRSEANEAHAVHMAIALNELSMLGVSANELDPLLGSQKGDVSDFCRLNVMRLITKYAARFDETDTVDGLNYYYLLRHYKSVDGSNLMFKCICSFILRNFKTPMLKLMFGNPDPTDLSFYTGGFFDQLPCTTFEKNSLATMLAEELADRCEYDLASEVYLITGALDMSMHLLCCLMSQMVYLSTPKENLRRSLSMVSARLYSGAARDTVFLSAPIANLFKLLSLLMRFFDHFHGGNYSQALEILDETELIPKNSIQVAFCVSRSKVFTPEHSKVLPCVLLATMQIYFRQFKKSSSAKIVMRERAKALINFAAALPQRMSPNTNMRLVKMELQMQVD
ncbi:hypothetical protein KR093_003944 [Drosophila rubida]|uniref:Nuclear pore protein n=1 Tax=Drosophila rubida TaxID=30044 RepID=A0AAD4PM19_9MUSC|nr:hypothetical protein KR093_003944 [Drosophila rubida]